MTTACSLRRGLFPLSLPNAAMREVMAPALLRFVGFSEPRYKTAKAKMLIVTLELRM